jgi:hypothetical protein
MLLGGGDRPDSGPGPWSPGKGIPGERSACCRHDELEPPRRNRMTRLLLLRWLPNARSVGEVLGPQRQQQLGHLVPSFLHAIEQNSLGCSRGSPQRRSHDFTAPYRSLRSRLDRRIGTFLTFLLRIELDVVGRHEREDRDLARESGLVEVSLLNLVALVTPGEVHDECEAPSAI